MSETIGWIELGLSVDKVNAATADATKTEYFRAWRDRTGVHEPLALDLNRDLGTGLVIVTHDTRILDLADPAHPEPCIAALKAGKHVICEKPMAVSADDARRMRDAAAGAKGTSMCTFNYRFMPAVGMAKKLIDQRKLGTIYQMRTGYLQMAGHDPATRPEQAWYAAWPHSGGLQGIGSHAIDQCRFLVGEIAGGDYAQDRYLDVLQHNLNAALGLWQELRTEQAVAALKDMTSPHALVIRNGRVVEILSSELVVGDVLALEEGDAVEVKEKVYEEETIANYRMAVLILSTVAAVFFIVIVLLLLR